MNLFPFFLRSSEQLVVGSFLDTTQSLDLQCVPAPPPSFLVATFGSFQHTVAYTTQLFVSEMIRKLLDPGGGVGGGGGGGGTPIYKSYRSLLFSALPVFAQRRINVYSLFYVFRCTTLLARSSSSYTFAYVLAVCVECPTMNLEKLLIKLTSFALSFFRS